MVWVRLDDAILDNPKVIRVGPIGFALHVAAMTWCGRNCTDGFIPEAKAKQTLSTTWTTAEANDGKEQIWELAATSKHAGFEGHEVMKEAIRLLVSVGLWHEGFDERGNFGYWLHDYLEYNPSRAQVRGKSEKRAAAGRAGGKQSGSTRQAKSKQKRSKPPSKVEAKTKPEPEPEPHSDHPHSPPRIPKPKRDPLTEDDKRQLEVDLMAPRDFVDRAVADWLAEPASPGTERFEEQWRTTAIKVVRGTWRDDRRRREVLAALESNGADDGAIRVDETGRAMA